MRKLYTKISILFLFFMTHAYSSWAQVTDGVQLGIDAANYADNVTNVNNTTIGDYSGQYGDYRYLGTSVYATSAFRNSSGAVTYPFPAGTTAKSKFSGATHLYAFGSESGRNAFWLPFESGNSNTMSFSTTAPMKGLYFIYTFVATTSSAVGYVDFVLNYTDNTQDNASSVSIYDFRTTSISGTSARWPISLVNTSDRTSNDNYCMVELNLTSLFANMNGKTPKSLVVTRHVGNGATGTMYFHALTEIPVSKIQGTVFSDNSADGTANGTGTNSAAGFVSVVNGSTIVSTTTVSADGTYTLWGTPYVSGGSYKVILTSTSQTVGSTLSASSLNTGWVSGTTPNASNSGDGTTSVISIARSSATTDNTGVNFSVHKLPTSYDRTNNFSNTAAAPIPSDSYKYPLTSANTTAGTATQSLSGNRDAIKLYDFFAKGSVASSGIADGDNLNGANSNSRFIITAISDGSVYYNNAPVTLNTVYPTSGTYANSTLAYVFPTNSSLTSKSFTFNYKLLDNLGFVSAANATYTIGLAYALPVTYTKELSATVSNKQVTLNWTTGVESNNNFFDVQRSADGKQWSSLTQIPSHFLGGNGSGYGYSYNDLNPFGGTNYYRLNQVDLDGKNKLSGVVSAEIPLDLQSIKVYPNPVINTLNVSGIPTSATSLAIYSMDGKLLLQQNINNTSISLALKNYPSAMYILVLSDKNGKRLKSLNFSKQ